MEHIRCLIAGSGPAGYTAAIYAARAGLQPVLYQGLLPLGQLAMTTDVENFPSYPAAISGTRLVENMHEQALRLGAEVRAGVIVGSDLACKPFCVRFDDGRQALCDALIIATGAAAKYLGLPSEQKFLGQGVSACATCDGFFYRNQDVAVIGGGDTACEEALYLAGICCKVYMVVRRAALRAARAMQDRVLAHPRISMLWESQAVEIIGDTAGVSGVLLKNNSGQAQSIAVSGVFVAIGSSPSSAPFCSYVETDAQGYIKVQAGSQRTNVDGVFACGDVQDPVYKQAITAAASGCRAALDAERYLAGR